MLHDESAALEYKGRIDSLIPYIDGLMPAAYYALVLGLLPEAEVRPRLFAEQDYYTDEEQLKIFELHEEIKDAMIAGNTSLATALMKHHFNWGYRASFQSTPCDFQ